MAIIDGHIRCGTCGEPKPLEAFAPAVRRRGHGTCRPCKNALNRDYDDRNREAVKARALAWVERNREAVRKRALASYYRNAEERRAKARDAYKRPGNRALKHAQHIAREFGVTREEYDAMLRAQGGVCALCGDPPSDRQRLAVDHDHETGQLRGLLCLQCNTALGRLGDTAGAFERVMAYLRGAAPAPRREISRTPALRINLLRGAVT
jgi:hypothetical protein